MADLRVNFCGVELKNPITTASGTFGFGHEYGEFFDLSQLGGIGVKGLTPTERLGNPAPRIAETPQGILNCVGLQNPGIDRFIEEQIPFLRRYDTKIIANVSGNTVEEYEGMVEKISDADVDLIEMNISCPKEAGVPCQVSMEERMGCGIGACLVCACALKSENGETRYGHVCKDGPVFNAEEVEW